MIYRTIIFFTLLCSCIASIGSTYADSTSESLSCECVGGIDQVDSLFRDLIIKKHGLKIYDDMSISINLLFFYVDSSFTNPIMSIDYFCDSDSLLVQSLVNDLMTFEIYKKYYVEKKEFMLRRYIGGNGGPGFTFKICGIKR